MLHAGLECFFQEHLGEVRMLNSTEIADFHTLYLTTSLDLIILGVNEHFDEANMSFVKRLKTWYPQIPVVVYADELLPYLGLVYLKSGANGYLAKQNSTSELMDCIHKVMNGKQYVCKEVQDFLYDITINKEKKGLRKPEILTSREYEIANYLSQGMSITDIAGKLGRKITTISTIKTRLFSKLNVRNVINLREAIGIKSVPFD